MNRLYDLASVLRSKNSGPFEVSFDILFDNKENYLKVVNSKKINKKNIANLYSLDEKDIIGIIFFPQALGIKITINRAVSSGSIGDRDVYGAQQSGPIAEILI